ncbi:hypothetical protein DFH09DRAFT_1115799 [Mycena vulgaris]|nr:hypothetical protein DFH09DRAFT_1115799 [Mycena vulgaris]
MGAGCSVFPAVFPGFAFQHVQRIARSSNARPGNGKCTQRFCKDCCFASTLHCHVSAHNSLHQITELPIASSSSARISPSHPISYAGPYGKMVAPDVAHKLHNHDFSISPSNCGQKEAYRMEAACIIYIKWWIKNNERPILLAVPAPSFPWFHPKDCQALCDRVGLPCDVYEYLQLSTPIEFTLEEDDSWILTPGPIRVKPDITLYLRSPNVTKQKYQINVSWTVNQKKQDCYIVKVTVTNIECRLSQFFMFQSTFGSSINAAHSLDFTIPGIPKGAHCSASPSDSSDPTSSHQPPHSSGNQACCKAFNPLSQDAKVIVVPELEDKTGYESDLTATPEDLKNYTPLPATEEAGLITMDVDVQGEDRMDVDSDAEEQSLKQEDNPKQFERQSWGEPEEFDPQFWGLIARTSDDKPGTVKLIILNYARDGDKAQGYFHPAIFDPEEYGPDGSGRLYLDTETVFKSLDDLGALPDAPWLCKWALPGYPWTIGPIAFQRSAEVPAQLDETELASPLAGTHVEADIKEELDVKPDVKLSARAKGQSDAAKAKNSAMVAYLEKRLLNYPGVKAIRDAPRVRGSHPVPTVVAWVHTVASLVNAYKKCMDRTYGDAFNKAITYDNWGKLFNRAAGWVTSCVLAEPYIRSCASQADVEKLLADESLSVGVPSLIQLIEMKAFLSYNEFLEAKVPEE